MSSTKTNKIIGIARNFQRTPATKDYPVFFSKPWSSLVLNGDNIKLQKNTIINYEFELGVMISKECKRIKAKDYLNYIGGYFLSLDLTENSGIPLRTKNGGTWTLCKGYDYLTPIGEFIEKKSIPNPNNVVLELVLNGKRVQLGNTKDFTYSIDDQIEILSYHSTLYPGDLLLTGTFDNMCPINIGDKLEGNLYLNHDNSSSNNEKLCLNIENPGESGNYNGRKPDFRIEFSVEEEKEKIRV